MYARFWNDPETDPLLPLVYGDKLKNCHYQVFCPVCDYPLQGFISLKNLEQGRPKHKAKLDELWTIRERGEGKGVGV